jgi:pyruvate dehydrogenase E2 component (dihydrolipoamide acetyltransferase)
MTPGRAGGEATALEPRYVKVGRGRIFHYDIGEGEPVILLHGYNHHAEAWVRNIVPLAGTGRRVIALDLPGFGRSGIPRMRYSLAGYSAFLVAFMDALGIDAAHLVGSSMGGAIALRVGVDHPGRVWTVTGVDPAGIFTSVPRAWSIAANPVAKLLIRPFLGQKRLLEWSHSRAYFDSSISSTEQTDLMAEAYTQPGYKDHILGMAESMLLAPEEELLWNALPGIKPAVLIVWGRQDRTISVQHAYRAAQRIPSAEVVIYDRCGHLPMYEKAEEFNSDLAAFLARHPGAPQPNPEKRPRTTRKRAPASGVG